MLNYSEAEEFIRHVFDYFNGKVNKVNYPAELYIEWMDSHRGVLGSSCNPLRVYIYPINIYNTCIAEGYANDQVFDFGFKLHVIESIIHELSHLDQNKIDAYTGMYRNIEDLENENVYNTMQYMAKHVKQISKEFDIDLKRYSKDINKMTADFINKYPESKKYELVSYFNWIYSILLEVGGISESEDACKFIYNDLAAIFNQSESIIQVLLIDDNQDCYGTLIIKKGDYLTPCNIIHEFFNNAIYSGTILLRGDVTIQCTSDIGVYNIIFMVRPVKEMCFIIEGGNNNEN